MKNIANIILFVIMIITCVVQAGLIVACMMDSGGFPHFWTTTGFAPALFFMGFLILRNLYSDFKKDIK